MSKNLDPKCKQCRRVGEKLFLKAERCSTTKCAMVKKNYPPGLHGPKGKPKQTGYGLQLTEKQKARKQYLLSEKQFRITFEKAKSSKSDTGSAFLTLLEKRLDNTVYRAGFANSRSQARHLVNHGHFTVNDKKCNIPSRQVKEGDIIAVKPKSQKSKLFNNLEKTIKPEDRPSWINTDAKKLTAKILHNPTKQDLEKIKVDVHMIVEYYSR